MEDSGRWQGAIISTFSNLEARRGLRRHDVGTVAMVCESRWVSVFSGLFAYAGRVWPN